MSAGARVEIPGSQRELVPGHVRVADLDRTERVTTTVYLRHRRAPDESPDDRQRLARDEWAGARGADPDDVEAVRAFAADHGLTVSGLSPARRALQLAGDADAVGTAFGIGWAGMYAPAEGETAYRARTGPVTVPAGLDGVITGVFGIDGRPQARPQIRFSAQPSTSYTPVEVAQAYGFPSGGAAGETVAIVELGGGYATADLTAYFAELGIAAPTVTAVSVDGGANDPGANPDADGEVMLDIEVIGAVAPGASIAVYFAPNTDQGFIDAVSEAVHDTTHRPSVVSISWGGSEDTWTAQARTQMETILTDAGTLGVTVCVAAGDGGSSDGATDGEPHVDFPASAPHALACGGTRMEASGATISSETVWSTAGGGATGGGVSRQFPVPSYQANAKLPTNAQTHAAGRGVPDVAGDADPDTGYRIRVDGADQTIGGTSAVAPLWAGLVALLNRALGSPLGFANPRLYALLGAAGFHDITSGSNGAYAAGPGWDACTGLGSPDGAQLVGELRAPAAG